MNKKTIAVLALSAFIMSAAAAPTTYAAGLALPGGSKLGDDAAQGKDKAKKKDKDKIQIHLTTKTELKYDEAHAAKTKHEGKLYFTGRVDDMFTAMVGLNIESKSDNSSESEKDKWEMENVWLEYQRTPEFSLRFGRQTYHVAKGLFIDQDGVMGGKAIYNIDKNNILEAFAGRDDQKRYDGLKIKDGKIKVEDPSKTTLLQVLNYAHKFNDGALGTFWAKQGRQNGDIDRYWGMYGKYDFSSNVDLNFEYLKNTFTDKRGYVAELKFGNLKKTGDYTFGLNYLDTDSNLSETNKYTDFDSQYDPNRGFKGPGVIIANKLSKNSKLTLQRWWGKSKDDADSSLPVTKLTLVVKF